MIFLLLKGKKKSSGSDAHSADVPPSPASHRGGAVPSGGPPPPEGGADDEGGLNTDEEEMLRPFLSMYDVVKRRSTRCRDDTAPPESRTNQVGLRDISGHGGGGGQSVWVYFMTR